MLRKNLIISAVAALFAIEGYFIYQEHIKPENIAIKQINDIQKSIASLTDKCRSSIWTTLPDIKDRHILDSLYGRATQKENECLKKELLSLIKQTYDRPQDQELMCQLVDSLEKNTIQFYQTGINQSIYCKVKDNPDSYDCGSFAKYISAPTEWNRQLLRLYEFVLTRKYSKV